jgi:uncharacterized peroxidase-related enzyme
VGLLTFRPETAGPIGDLANTLLRAPNSLTRGERELIAASVSSGNECQFCASSHSAVAARELGDGALVEQVVANAAAAGIPAKMRALLHIADRVRVSGKAVVPEDIAAAREAGASDVEIHDTVLIAAAFCMMNRYVDGLGTFAPDDPSGYAEAAEMIVANGYPSATRQPA